MNTETGNIIIDKEFDETMMVEVKTAIASAFINLEANIRGDRLDSQMCARDKIFVNEKAHQAKCEITTFIDAQVDRLLSDSLGNDSR